ncbi:MAG: hypothetical protein R3C58_05850 [Parvularculaceae bacterium]
MKNPLEKLKAVIGELGKITDIEHAAITKRAFNQLAGLTAQKESLLAEFDEHARELDASELTDQLLKELEEIRGRAEENAAMLKASAAGVREARARLKKIREAEHNTGAYRADGGALRNPDASTVATKF